jgi:hypothetical protein
MPNISPVFVPASDVNVIAAKTIKITNLTLSLANTEYNHPLQSKLKQLKIKSRSASRLQYAFIEGDSSVQFQTIPKFCEEFLSGLDFTDKILYIQTDSTATIVEIVELY